MGVRQYDPKNGRFLSIDPFFEKFSSQSPYQYAYNNPISFKDPTGFEPESEKGGEDRMQWAVIKDDLKFSAMILDQARQLMNQDGNLDTGPGSYTGWELSWNQIQNYFLKQYGGSGGGGLPLTNDVASKADGMTTYGYWDIIESREQWKLEHPEVVDPDDGVRTGTYIYTSPNGTKTIVNYRYKSSQNENYIKKMISGGLDYMAGSPTGSAALGDYTGAIKVDLTMTGNEIGDLYDHTPWPFRNKWPFLGGITSNTWGYPNLAGSNSSSAEVSGFEKGWIYIASEYLDPSYQKDIYTYKSYNYLTGTIQNAVYKFSMIFSHEFKHTYDAMNICRPIDHEKSAVEFTRDIFNFYNFRQGRVYIHWKY